MYKTVLSYIWPEEIQNFLLLGRSPGKGHGNPLQYSCLENPTDRGAWWATTMGSKESDMTERLNHHHHQPESGLWVTHRYLQMCEMYFAHLLVISAILMYMHAQLFSCVQFFGTPRTVAPQVPLPTGFPSQEYWSGLPFPPPGDLPDPGIEPLSLAPPVLQVDSLPVESSQF